MTTDTSTPSPTTPDAGVQTPTPEVLLTDGKPAADGADTTAKPEEAAVEYAFEAPDGMEMDEARLAKFVDIAKALKLPKEKAQQIVELEINRVQAEAQAFIEQVNGWAEQVKADPDLGGDKLPETLAIAKKAIDLGPPELKELLNKTGMCNHPVMVRWAHSIGKALSEGSYVAGSTPPAGAKSAADLLYPTTAKS